MGSSYSPASGGGGSGLGSSGSITYLLWNDQEETAGGPITFTNNNLSKKEGQLTGGVDRWISGRLLVPAEWDGNDVIIRVGWRPFTGNNGNTVKWRMAWGHYVEGALLVEATPDSPVDTSYTIPAGDTTTQIQFTEMSIPASALIAGDLYDVMVGRWAGTIPGDSHAGTVHPHFVQAVVGLA